MARCEFSLSPTSGIPHPEFLQLARTVEDSGFDGIFIPEANNDALMCSYAVAGVTRRVAIATWIVDIYLREPTLCAAAAEMVQDAAAGRFILGLGASHRPALEARGIDMGNARDRLRRDTTIIRATLAGETSMFGLKFRQPSKPIPIYYAALGLETAHLGGELADGLMPYPYSPARVRKSIDVAQAAAKQHGRASADVVTTVGLPVFLHADLELA
jgi:alkanesulfonate monooxygenase SsuD/methylene tetrahydromethanopterin reductase-like flavin-dependent oxidoreductase (luciferase family)